MTGYSWISITALFCYLFLLLTFLAAPRKERVIRSFMMLMLIMILWVGGSFAMRMQLWPSVNLWHHVSVLGMMMLASGYYHFTLDFLEERNGRGRWFWTGFHLLLFVVDCLTCWFIPEPLVVERGGSAQFIYHYNWHIYLLVVCVMACVVHIAYMVRRHCKGNRIAFQQLKPIIYGIGILLLGHVAATLSVFEGLPLDILSGVGNVFFMFYALYKKQLFRMTLLLSRVNYMMVAVALGCIAAYRIADPLQAFFTGKVGLNHTAAVVAMAAVLVVLVLVIYGIIALVLNFIFVRDERQQQQKIDRFAENINHKLSVSEILGDLTDVIQQTTHLDRMAVFVRQTDGDFRVEYTTNPLDEKGFYLRGDHPLVTHLRKTDQWISLLEFRRTTIWRSMWEKEKKLFDRLKADCFVPLCSENELVGILMIPEKKEKPRREADLLTAQAISRLCATALKDAYVYERAIDEARIDKLTGLINRKYFLELLDREFEQYKDTALSLCLLNIDDFKLYNQLYGTHEGDIALSRVAGIIRATLNEACHGARIGGKEFALLLPGYDIYSAKLLTDNLVAEIMEINSRRTDQVTRKLTVSAGVCGAPYMASTAKELFRNAETAVYTVKRSGKNAVQIYSSDIYHQEEPHGYHSGYGENAGTIYALTAAIDARDHYTYQHSQNVAYYAAELAKAAGMENDLVEIVKEAGLLHDIGKIGIREDILNKPGDLTREEYEAMKGHVENGVNIIRYLPALDYVIPAVLSHHERYDGLGYPRRLKGEQIPITGRILAIADAFDAMTTARIYKEAMTVEETLEIMEKESGWRFDPKLALIFMDLMRGGTVEIRGHKNTGEPVALDHVLAQIKQTNCSDR